MDESGQLLEGAAAQAGSRLPPIAQSTDPQAQITGGQPETREKMITERKLTIMGPFVGKNGSGTE